MAGKFNARPLSSFSAAEWSITAGTVTAFLAIAAVVAWPSLFDGLRATQPPASAPIARLAPPPGPADLRVSLEKTGRFENWTATVTRLTSEVGTGPRLELRLEGANYVLVSHRITLTEAGDPYTDFFKASNLLSIGDRVVVSGELAKGKPSSESEIKVLVRTLKKI